ncbi:hypothetical protein [Mesorhizobium sp.]|uniref:hypothetical protein n=1 Tax=Mesorhizobium sp. TaxID=1871066 RepID=UPI000FE7DFAB|nr:hypothetical protein [Mesorhizobium sp.]RWC26020.1 MAG: hypothetical protein EOS27_26485 [Mesorhizobium sp.]TIX21856.1 MAG: hypothetical protein E5V35_28045 [Mesorhizobium sp.]
MTKPIATLALAIDVTSDPTLWDDPAGSNAVHICVDSRCHFHAGMLTAPNTVLSEYASRLGGYWKYNNRQGVDRALRLFHKSWTIITIAATAITTDHRAPIERP